MRTFHKYIFKQILGVALMAIGFFILVLVVGNALRDITSRLSGTQLSLFDFLSLLLLIIPGVLPYALPMGLLMAVLIVFGRMSAQNEITAARAAGMSFMGIIMPIFLVAILGWLLALGVNLYYAPIADLHYKKTLSNIIRKDPLKFIQPKVFVRDFPGYILYASEKSQDQLFDFWIWELDNRQQVSLFLKARQGTISFDDDQAALILTVYQGIAEKRSEKNLEDFTDTPLTLLTFDQVSIKLPLDKILGGHSSSKKLSLHTLSELLMLREKYKATNYQQQIVIQLEIQKKFSMAFSIFALTFLAIPLGMKVSRSETMVNLFIALMLAMTYYVCVVMISWTERLSYLRPDLLIWIPNIVFQSIGVYYLRKATRS